MGYQRLSGDILAFALAAFFATCAQAHVTSYLTPSFADMVHASIEPLNEHVFWFLGVDATTLNRIFTAVNVVLVSTLMSPATRTAGLAMSIFFLSWGLWGDIVMGESVAPHVVLLLIGGSSLALR